MTKRKLHLVPSGCVSPETMYRNVDLCKARGLPEARSRTNRPKLAVVGGGVSAMSCMEELRNWPGDIWACGSVFQWLQTLGIQSTVFCVDPQPCLAQMVVGARRALLASNCDPSAFDVLEASGAHVETFDLVNKDVGIHHGPTTASAAFDLSVKMGYLNVSFFGFDSSYSEEEIEDKPETYRTVCRTHAFKTEPEPCMVRIVANGKAYLTSAEFFMQAQWMAQLFTELPSVFKNRSGGLLAALIADPDYDCTHVSPKLAEGIQETAMAAAA